MGKFIDLTGQKIGRLTVIERAENYISPNGQAQTQWLCQCECNGEDSLKLINGYPLRRKITQSCGCLQKEKASELNFKDMTGEVFGKLKVIKRVENYISPKGKIKTMWLCECNCNKKKKIVVFGESLRRGFTRSCGCLHREMLKKYNTFDLTGEYGIGYTTNGNEFYFDLEDYDLIKDYCWCKDNHDYIITRIDEKNILLMHRLIMNCPDNMEVDHIFHDTWDNRKEFLRIVTDSKNSMNRGLFSNNTSGVTGVSLNTNTGKWHSYIQKDNNFKYLGAFDDIEDAIQIRQEAEIKYFGEYSYKEKIINTE